MTNLNYMNKKFNNLIKKNRKKYNNKVKDLKIT